MKKLLQVAAFAVVLTSLSLTLNGQTKVAEWEAEDYVLNAFAGGSGTEPAIESKEPFSGGKVVRGISNSNFIMNNFYVETEGTYSLKVYYSYTKDESAFQGGFITTRINSQTKQTSAQLTVQGTNVGDVIQQYDVLVYCETGWNTLKIGQNGNGKYNPYIDKCELYTTESNIAKPDDDPDALLATMYPVSFEKSKYSWDLTEVAQSISIEGSAENATLPNLTDNDLGTVFLSAEDAVTIMFEYSDAVVVKHVIMNDALRIGTFKLEAYDGTAEEWKLIDKKSAYCLFTDGAVWYDTRAGDQESYTKYRLTLYKAPGASQIEVADVLFVGYYYTKDIQNGTGTYRYMIDDLKTDEKGEFVECSAVVEGYNGLTGFQALDNARGSKFSVKSKAFQLVYRFDTSAKVTSFAISNATSRSRDARTFEIQGSNDSILFTPLYSIENLDWKANNYMFGGNIETPDFYKFYRFDLQANNGDGSFSELGDLLFFGEHQALTPVGMDNMDYILRAYAINGNIVIDNNTGKTVEYQILDLMGKLVKCGTVTDKYIPVDSGIYLVRLSGEDISRNVTKVVVY